MDGADFPVKCYVCMVASDVTFMQLQEQHDDIIC